MIDQLLEVDPALRFFGGVHPNVAVRSDGEVALPPAIDLVQLGSVCDRPGIPWTPGSRDAARRTHRRLIINQYGDEKTNKPEARSQKSASRFWLLVFGFLLALRHLEHAVVELGARAIPGPSLTRPSFTRSIAGGRATSPSGRTGTYAFTPRKIPNARSTSNNSSTTCSSAASACRFSSVSGTSSASASPTSTRRSRRP